MWIETKSTKFNSVKSSMRTLTLLNVREKNIVFNSIQFNLISEFKFKFHWIEFLSNSMYFELNLRIWFELQIHSIFSLIKKCIVSNCLRFKVSYIHGKNVKTIIYVWKQCFHNTNWMY
jgi:hypothetical protein